MSISWMVLGLTLSLVGCQTREAQPPQQPREAAPLASPGANAGPPVIRPPAIVTDTAFPGLDGKDRRIRDFQGKILVVDIWATWCGPCRIEIPHLIKLASELKGQGVEVLGLTTEDPAEDTPRVRQFVDEFKINYPIGFARGEFARFLMQGKDVIPQTYVIGRDGRLIRHFIGFNVNTSPPQLRAAVEEAIKMP